MDKTVKTILKIGGIFAATQVCEPTKKLRYKSIMAVKDFFKKYDK